MTHVLSYVVFSHLYEHVRYMLPTSASPIVA